VVDVSRGSDDDRFHPFISLKDDGET
jgi:hypothetical protein